MIRTFVNKIETENGINYLNVFLMVISCVIAFLIPFHLFLFVYAFLGPLHYLTEISWLEKRNFFLPKKSDVIFYLIISILIFFGLFIPTIANFTTSLICFTMVLTLIILFVKNNLIKYIVTGIAAIILIAKMKDANLVHDGNLMPIILFSVLVPTLIHVYVFTGIFLINGAIKQKLISGYLSVGFFILCTISFFIFSPSDNSTVSNEIKLMFERFKMMNKALMYVLGIDNYHTIRDIWTQKQDTIYNSPGAISVMRFIAFAYCYHYLNWFSKTSIIKWHQISKKRLWLILILWLIAVGLYAINYNIGFYGLFILSMLHVFFEFPLNFISIKNIFQNKKIDNNVRNKKT
jgi:hypothetical protein